MKLIGMLDSPYVRRVAISLQFLGLPFEHESVSVFSAYEKFRDINPVVKAPTLVCDDGDILLDSTLILEYAEALAGTRSLMPANINERQRALKVIGLALAACEKSIQIVYENKLRPEDKRHQPWLDRVAQQLQSALSLIEKEFAAHPYSSQRSHINQVGIATAVMWHFTQQMTPAAAPADRFPLLAAFSHAAEQLPEFLIAPFGDGTFPVQPQ